MNSFSKFTDKKRAEEIQSLISSKINRPDISMHESRIRNDSSVDQSYSSTSLSEETAESPLNDPNLPTKRSNRHHSAPTPNSPYLSFPPRFSDRPLSLSRFSEKFASIKILPTPENWSQPSSSALPSACPEVPRKVPGRMNLSSGCSIASTSFCSSFAVDPKDPKVSTESAENEQLPSAPADSNRTSSSSETFNVSPRAEGIEKLTFELRDKRLGLDVSLTDGRNLSLSLLSADIRTNGGGGDGGGGESLTSEEASIPSRICNCSSAKLSTTFTLSRSKEFAKVPLICNQPSWEDSSSHYRTATSLVETNEIPTHESSTDEIRRSAFYENGSRLYGDDQAALADDHSTPQKQNPKLPVDFALFSPDHNSKTPLKQTAKEPVNLIFETDSNIGCYSASPPAPPVKSPPEAVRLPSKVSKTVQSLNEFCEKPKMNKLKKKIGEGSELKRSKDDRVHESETEGVKTASFSDPQKVGLKSGFVNPTSGDRSGNSASLTSENSRKSCLQPSNSSLHNSKSPLTSDSQPSNPSSSFSGARRSMRRRRLTATGAEFESEKNQRLQRRAKLANRRRSGDDSLPQQEQQHALEGMPNHEVAVEDMPLHEVEDEFLRDRRRSADKLLDKRRRSLTGENRGDLMREWPRGRNDKAGVSVAEKARAFGRENEDLALEGNEALVRENAAEEQENAADEQGNASEKDVAEEQADGAAIVGQEKALVAQEERASLERALSPRQQNALTGNKESSRDKSDILNDQLDNQLDGQTTMTKTTVFKVERDDSAARQRSGDYEMNEAMSNHLLAARGEFEMNESARNPHLADRQIDQNRPFLSNDGFRAVHADRNQNQLEDRPLSPRSLLTFSVKDLMRRNGRKSNNGPDPSDVQIDRGLVARGGGGGAKEESGGRVSGGEGAGRRERSDADKSPFIATRSRRKSRGALTTKTSQTTTTTTKPFSSSFASMRKLATTTTTSPVSSSTLSTTATASFGTLPQQTSVTAIAFPLSTAASDVATATFFVETSSSQSSHPIPGVQSVIPMMERSLASPISLTKFANLLNGDVGRNVGGNIDVNGRVNVGVDSVAGADNVDSSAAKSPYEYPDSTESTLPTKKRRSFTTYAAEQPKKRKTSKTTSGADALKACMMKEIKVVVSPLSPSTLKRHGFSSDRIQLSSTRSRRSVSVPAP